MKPVDLGHSFPSEKLDVATPKKEPKKSFPSFHVSNKPELNDLPSGKFHFKGTGKVVHKSTSTRDGKTTHSHEIEIHSIHHEPKEGSAKEESLESKLTEMEEKKRGVD